MSGGVAAPPYYAGHEAAKRLDPSVDEVGASADNEQAAELLSEISDPPSVSKLREQAAKLLAEHWPTVEAVAGALLEHETLGGQELMLICSAVDYRSDWREDSRQFRLGWPDDNR